MSKRNDDENAKRSWFKRHKILTALLVFVGLIIVIAAAGGGSKSNSSNANGTKDAAKTSTAKQYRFSDRADKQPKDVEVLSNEAATVDGVQMTVTNVEYKTSISEYEAADSGKTYLIATVSLTNSSDRTKAYNVYDFRVQTAAGQVLDNTYATVPSPLSSGDVVAGGKATGQVVFEVPVEQSHQYMIWKPSFSSDRAIVQVQ